MSIENGLLLTNLLVIHADENFGAELNDFEKKESFERKIEISFNEIQVLDICKWLDVWFSSVTNRKVNHMKITEIFERGYKELEISFNYNNYTFFSEIIKYDNNIIEKIKNVIK